MIDWEKEYKVAYEFLMKKTEQMANLEVELQTVRAMFGRMENCGNCALEKKCIKKCPDWRIK